MRLLAFDLASLTGYCVGDTSELPTLGSIQLPSTGPEVGPFIDFFDQWLHMLFERHSPEAVVFEAPFIDPKFPNMTTTRKLSGLCSQVELFCYRKKIEVRETSNISAKKAVGSGKFKKPDVMAAAKRCGLEPANYDESDAFAVWICGLQDFAPVDVSIWDAKLHGY